MRILLIEDEEKYLKELVPEVEKEYVVDVAYSGENGTFLSEVNEYDAIIVDSTLPDMSGLQVCKTSRSLSISAPILYLGDKSLCDEEKLESLRSGADAYVSKPINYEELKVKLGVLLRRRGDKYFHSVVCLGKLKIDMNARSIFVDGKRVDLRRMEYDVLEYLVLNIGRVVSKEELLEHVWKKGLYVFSNTVEVHIRNLRERLEKPYGLEIIKTVRGFGYRIAAINKGD